MFDIEPGNMAQKTWLPRAHPDDVDKIEYQWNRFMQGFTQDRFEWRVLRPGATNFDSEDNIIYLESCGFPTMAADGTFESVTGLTTDVSIVKAYQREQAEKLESALEAKRTQEYFMGKWHLLYCSLLPVPDSFNSLTRLLVFISPNT